LSPASLNEISITNPLTIGIIGGGQLGKMIALAAKQMALKVCVLDPSNCCPCSSVSDELIVADFKDAEAIKKLASKSDVVTYEIELANTSALMDLASENANLVNPSPKTLQIIQDKYKQKSFLKKFGLRVPSFSLIESRQKLFQICKKYGFPTILKARYDSYDGKGNYTIKTEKDIVTAYSHFGLDKKPMLEKYVHFSKEISIMVARNMSGQITSFPVAENIHRDHILNMSIVPARISDKVAWRAKKMAEKALDALKGAGIFGIEMFVTNDDVVINEIAPRPHNSGHYSIEACSVSQFEQHIRAILNLPLTEPRLLSPAAVMLNLLGPDNFEGPYAIRGLRKALSTPGLNLHIYGKKISKPRRKLGHFTITGISIKDVMIKADNAKRAMKIEHERR
jgi:5-(carboxyamino)imidazole ribonucleotide synthase